MNKLYILWLVFFINITCFSAAYTWCITENCKKAEAFDEQMRYFANGSAFVTGMQDHVKHLLDGVESLAEKHPDSGCLMHSKSELVEILAFLGKNKNDIVAAYDAECNRAPNERLFESGPVYDVSERLKGLARLEENPFCDDKASGGHGDLQSLYALVDQRGNVEKIQVKQMKRAEEQPKGSDLVDDQHMDEKQPQTWHLLPPQGTWTRFMVLGSLLVGVGVVIIALRDKIDAWLLTDEEQDQTQQYRRLLANKEE